MKEFESEVECPVLYHVLVPDGVIEHLGLEPSDVLVWRVGAGGEVAVRKKDPGPAAPFQGT